MGASSQLSSVCRRAPPSRPASARSRSRRWLAATACFQIILAASACQRQPASVVGDRLNFGGDFTLTNQDGKPFSLGDVRGRAVLLFFGYTSCPDMCPMTMSRIVSALDRLGPDASQVVTLFVSVDPKRDTPAALKEYVGSFSTPLVGLTGTEEEIARVTTSYHAAFERVENGSPNYLVNHTTAIFLIDKQGQLREFFAYNEDPKTIAAAIESVLKEK